jgi:predicted NAD/FAD-binding protein
MRVAIVGSGIAGLTVAHHLHRDHEVTVYEAGTHAGGHVHTHDVELGGRGYAVDSGFIVFNQRTYPRFVELLDGLGVESRATEMSFSVACGRSGLEYNGRSLDTLFAQRGNLARPAFWGMLRDILRFNRQAPALVRGELAPVRLGELLARGGYGAMFRDYYLLPMAAAIWSTDPQRVLDFPARFFVGFCMNHGLLSIADRPAWRVIRGGSRAYVERLVAPFRERVRLRTPVLGLARGPGHVDLCLADGRARHDAVFLACHSDQALALLEDPTPAEREVLSAIPYQANQAVLHTDARLLPRRPRARAAWNYRMPDGPGGRVSVTYDMNLLQGLGAPEPLCVTLNPAEPIDPDRVIARMTYHHPLFTAAGVAAQARHREIDGTRGTYYCGAWWRNGFHEDGVVSALDTLGHFEADRRHAELPLRRLGAA